MQHQQQQHEPPQQGVGYPLIRDPYSATEEQFQHFVRGLDAVLNQWTALHLVAGHCDPLALQSMYRELLDWFQTDGEVYSDDLEIFFENFFTEARAVVIEDDSMKEVGDVLHEMYCRCCQNDFSLVEQYLSSLEVYRRVNPVRLSVNGGGEEEEEALDDAPMEGVIDAADTQEAEGNEKENENENENEEEMTPQQEPPHRVHNKRNKKNAYDRDNDGWCVVRR